MIWCEKEDPAIARDDFHQVLLDAARVVVLGEFKPSRDAMDVGVDDNTFGDTEPRTEDHVGGLTGGAGNGEKFVHGLRNFSAKVVHDGLGGANDRLGLVAKESGRANVVFKFFGLEGSEVLGRRILLK